MLYKVDFLHDKAIKYTKSRNFRWLLLFSFTWIGYFPKRTEVKKGRKEKNRSEQIGFDAKEIFDACACSLKCHRFKWFPIDCYRTWYDVFLFLKRKVNQFGWSTPEVSYFLRNIKAFPILISGSIPISFCRVSHFHFQYIFFVCAYFFHSAAFSFCWRVKHIISFR